VSRRAALSLGALLLLPLPAGAQGRDPVSGFVVDVRAASAKLPTDQGWTPVLPADSLVPSRGLGFDLGAHVYAGRLGPARLGVGGSVLIARGTAVPGAAAPNVTEVATRFAAITPQVSFNFGHRLGWSYLSGGAGPAQVHSSLALVAASGGTTVDEPWGLALNYGGGARWFIMEHLAFGFDVRWYRLGSREAIGARPEAPGTTRFVLNAGVSFR
jgi:opacity protein-like surface antigen